MKEEAGIPRILTEPADEILIRINTGDQKKIPIIKLRNMNP